jgi:hypothetical protein
MHDYKDALREVLHQVYRNTDDFEMRISKDCYKLIIEALEKQIPKKLKDDGWLYCPICGRDVLMDRFDYCPDCGQALDWSDTND